MRRALFVAALVLVACDAVGAGFFTLGTFQRSFPASLEPVEIPGFDVSELLDPPTLEQLAKALGYDVDELIDAGADFARLQSVVDATRAIGVPLDDQDATLRSLLAAIVSIYVNQTLTNEARGIFVKVDLSVALADPLDYDDLEGSLLERARTRPVGVEVIRRMETIDEVFIANTELVALVRSGWLASLRIREIGLRTLYAEEHLRVLAGMGLRGSLYDPSRMEGCGEPKQARIHGLEAIQIELRSLAEGAPWVEVLDTRIESDGPICAWKMTLRSPELVDVLSQDQGLDIRVRVWAHLPAKPFPLGGYLWFDSESVNISVGEF
jgi:hypothetical protein